MLQLDRLPGESAEIISNYLLKVKMILQDNLKDGLGSEHYKEQMMNCYMKCYDYLDLWTEQFNYLEDFQWMGLIQEPLWENVEEYIQFLNSTSISIDDTMFQKNGL
jgi:hypothetical protein